MCGSPCFRGLQSLYRRVKRARPESFRAGCGKLSGGHKSFRGECGKYLRKFPQANSSVRGVCGSFRKPLQRAARLRKFPQASHYCAACLRTVQKVAADAQNDGNDYPNFSFCKPGVDNKKFFL